jgi:hypothetical protein
MRRILLSRGPIPNEHLFANLWAVAYALFAHAKTIARPQLAAPQLGGMSYS